MTISLTCRLDYKRVVKTSGKFRNYWTTEQLCHYHRITVNSINQWNQSINDQCFDDCVVMSLKQEACGVTGEFPLASATWWSPGTTCHCRKRRISTTDTRWAANAEWVRTVHSPIKHVQFWAQSVLRHDKRHTDNTVSVFYHLLHLFHQDVKRILCVRWDTSKTTSLKKIPPFMARHPLQRDKALSSLLNK